MKPIDLSYYIIQNYDNITPMKLQKLLYYAKVWGVVSGEHFVDGDFKKWQFGPVHDEVYQEYKKYGNQSIPKDAVETIQIPESKKEILNFILDSYAPYDAITLSSMTHQDEPWQKTANNSVITDKVIYQYYSKQLFAKNFPFNPNKPYYPVQSDLHYAYIFDMSAQDAEAASVFPSYIEYKKYMASAEQKLSSLFNSLV